MQRGSAAWQCTHKTSRHHTLTNAHTHTPARTEDGKVEERKEVPRWLMSKREAVGGITARFHQHFGKELLPNRAVSWLPSAIFLVGGPLLKQGDVAGS